MKLTIQNLHKTYANGVKALDQLDLEVGRGMFGLLGPNGAGKSTLMRIMATMQKPDSGRVSFGNIDVLQAPISLRKLLGYLPQDFGVYPGTSAEELLDYLARLKGIASKRERRIVVHKVLETTNLCEARRQHVSGYSGGMKQRFGIAQLLLNAPKLIIVDEPTAGLDPLERSRFLNVLRAAGTESTVILSTHIVDDVKDLCTQMAIMSGGKILRTSRPSQAIGELDGKIWNTEIEESALESYKSQYRILSSGYDENNTMTLRLLADERPGEEFVGVLPTLEDVYFAALSESQIS